MKPQLIAIDGPVASGKSSIGRLLAMKLGYDFVDTGIMYRALTWEAIKQGISLNDEEKLHQLAAETKISFISNEEGQTVLVNGKSVSSEVYHPEVERGVSCVSKVAGVRHVLVEEQRRLAQNDGVVMAGRDIGTVVLPWAKVKIYLEASAEERAHRRYHELLARGEEVSYSAVLSELRRRDEINSQRAVSPLQPASDAIIINTDGLTVEQVVDKIINPVGKE